jgi:hypothetical protein
VHIQLGTDNVRDALQKSSTIRIAFVTCGADGTATTARSACEVRIGKPVILITFRTSGSAGLSAFRAEAAELLRY